MLDRIESLRAEASAAIAAAPDAAALEELRVRHLGRKSELTGILRGIAGARAERARAGGRRGERDPEALEAELAARRDALEAAEIEAALAGEAIDVTLPGTPPVATGHLHLLERTRREIEDVFVGLGYRVMEGPEVEHDFYNFTALNHPPGHPGWMGQLLRRSRHPPRRGRQRAGRAAGADRRAAAYSPRRCRCVRWTLRSRLCSSWSRGRRTGGTRSTRPTCRCSIRSRGSPSPRISLADLAGTLDHAAKALFGPERRTAEAGLPFTEPSVQVDVSCFACDGTGRLADGRRDPICKGTGWIEILGAGMVDPNVFGFIERGYDPETTQGFAFGVGIERIAMLKHGAPDLRLFVENDVRFVEHMVRSPQSAVRGGSVNVYGLAARVLRSGSRPGGGRRPPLDARGRGRARERLGVPSTDGFVVGRVVSAEQHLNADRLRVCEVETGDGVRTIVCGAPNVAGGQAVAVALPGAGCPTAASSAARSCAASSPTA